MDPDYYKECEADAKLWIKSLGAIYGRVPPPYDALIMLCHLLERGYQRAETVSARSRWLRLVCGYLMQPSTFAEHSSSTNAKTTDNEP